LHDPRDTSRPRAAWSAVNTPSNVDGAGAAATVFNAGDFFVAVCAPACMASIADKHVSVATLIENAIITVD
jgi:hypothetical protein